MYEIENYEISPRKDLKTNVRVVDEQAREVMWSELVKRIEDCRKVSGQTLKDTARKLVQAKFREMIADAGHYFGLAIELETTKKIIAKLSDDAGRLELMFPEVVLARKDSEGLFGGIRPVLKAEIVSREDADYEVTLDFESGLPRGIEELIRLYSSFPGVNYTIGEPPVGEGMRVCPVTAGNDVIAVAKGLTQSFAEAARNDPSFERKFHGAGDLKLPERDQKIYRLGLLGFINPDDSEAQ